MSDVIYSWWCQLVGTYMPYERSGAFATDWGYVGASVLTILAFWYLLKMFTIILKGVFKSV